MYRITEEELPEEIMAILLPKDKLEYYLSLGGREKKIRNHLNEIYQYHPDAFRETNKGNYEMLHKLVMWNINNLIG